LPALLNGQSFDGCCWWVCFLFCFVLFWDRGLLCKPGWLWTQSSACLSLPSAPRRSARVSWRACTV
jgi:hypothetical protein